MKTPLGTTFLICLCFWQKIPITTISTILGVGKKTVGFWGSVIRVCCSKLWNSTQQVVGGEGKIVEIDEAIWRKRKYGRGRKKDQIWIFGGVERLEGGGAGSRFMTIVPNRKRNTFIPIIQKYILPKTMIISDKWRAYSCLETIGYGYQTVCHRKEYVNKETHACTNTIDGLWSHLRASFPRFATRKKYISDHIAMYLVKSSIKLGVFNLMQRFS
ncbi:putative Uncharacterized transposase-like protein [Monocercomonoides exilis]|uniref:putative Uncharacterized transposase-like protein n=1 Tax=Monocercomonoides exilis TaxID=2049356 RepID=UPI00355A7DE5|nr:putative Uncharacterized transposase-like protein [Monocercomonoides exilis]|eukprot:MONOS_2879.1-p1 / transcript=MONOS_2879.1 / gene=MONOS_2879 / organism=Monocercomonoides_exilis_PA203 / gene_product=Uncharacterized transposase-like protein HI1328.1 / transcript_product=Uncharacterized transposase-like protein HI1328.1 / location=Mono_scaffold00062:129029-129673(+) / protein_length=214 / sequence_SO=supercontig / SO=protein_coding / is_pseudo=false